jgi:hypothetical protein
LLERFSTDCVCTPHQPNEEFSMGSKLALSALVVASLFGATAIASAQTQQPAPGASSSGNVGPGAASDSKMKAGTTTGAGVKSGTPGSNARNPSSSGNVGPGTDNNNAPAPGGR